MSFLTTEIVSDIEKGIASHGTVAVLVPPFQNEGPPFLILLVRLCVELIGVREEVWYFGHREDSTHGLRPRLEGAEDRVSGRSTSGDPRLHECQARVNDATSVLLHPEP